MRIRLIKINGQQDAEKLFASIGVDKEAWGIMGPKTLWHNVVIDDIPNHIANMLKQEMLAQGGADCAVAREVGRYERGTSTVLLMGTNKHYHRLVAKLKIQPYGTKELAEEIERSVLCSKKLTLELKNRVFDFSKNIAVMGIINATPDSFYDGGKFYDTAAAVARAEQMASEGVDIIDIGGESTRPGAVEVGEDEEIKRILPIIKEVVKKFPDIPVSIDTYKSAVAKVALEAGASLVNDISGLRYDDNMVQTVQRFNVPVVVMHVKGTPRDMQVKPEYDDVVLDIYKYFEERIKYLTSNGITKNNIILDPGIGFGKKVEHNVELINRLGEFKTLGLPLLIGTSRKSFIGKILGTESNPIPSEGRLYGSLASYVIAIQNGTNILRVHDVAAAKQVVEITARLSK
ncbi:MAG: dihydropteroate synthase [Elusimicrobiota bacterium]